MPRSMLEAVVSGVGPVTSDLTQIQLVFGRTTGSFAVILGQDGWRILSGLNDDENEEMQAVDEMGSEKTVTRTTEHLQPLIP